MESGCWLSHGRLQEHFRVRDTAQTSLRRRSEAYGNTIGAVVRGQQFRGAALRENLEPVLKEVVGSDTNAAESSEVISIELIGNDPTNVLASAGRPINLEQADLRQAGEHWGMHSMTKVYPVEGAYLTNTLIIELSTNDMAYGRPRPPRDRMGMPGDENPGATNLMGTNGVAAGQFGPPRSPPPGDPGFRNANAWRASRSAPSILGLWDERTAI